MKNVLIGKSGPKRSKPTINASQLIYQMVGSCREGAESNKKWILGNGTAGKLDGSRIEGSRIEAGKCSGDGGEGESRRIYSGRLASSW